MAKRLMMALIILLSPALVMGADITITNADISGTYNMTAGNPISSTVLFL